MNNANKSLVFKIINFINVNEGKVKWEKKLMLRYHFYIISNYLICISDDPIRCADIIIMS